MAVATKRVDLIDMGFVPFWFGAKIEILVTAGRLLLSPIAASLRSAAVCRRFDDDGTHHVGV
jgi:hypothetical protein